MLDFLKALVDLRDAQAPGATCPGQLVDLVDHIHVDVAVLDAGDMGSRAPVHGNRQHDARGGHVALDAFHFGKAQSDAVHRFLDPVHFRAAGHEQNAKLHNRVEKLFYIHASYDTLFAAEMGTASWRPSLENASFSFFEEEEFPFVLYNKEAIAHRARTAYRFA